MTVHDHASLVPSAQASIAAVLAVTGAPVGYVPQGVHFNLHEAEYHAAVSASGRPYMGTGDVRSLIKCPMYYWEASAMNPLRECRDETPALLFGRALHKLVLEGRTAFEASYTATPEPRDYPGCLETVEHLKAALRDAGAPLSGVKAELIKRLKAAVPSAVVFDDILQAHLERCADGRMTSLKRSVYEKIIAAAAFIAGSDRVRPAFTGGRAEVSVFWEDDGVPLKCRLDYIKLGKRGNKLIGLPADLKSFSNSMGMPPERAVVRAIAEYRLDVQAAICLQGAIMIPEMLASGHAYGLGGIKPEWLSAIGDLTPEDWQWHWAFFQSDSPVSMLRSVEPNSTLIRKALTDIANALQAYRDNMTAFGTSWRYVDPMADIGIDLADMPSWISNAA